MSWLVDICRARIVLDGPDGVRRCLQAILLDSQGAKVVRVKNTLDPRLDARYSAGFRVSDADARLGLITGPSIPQAFHAGSKKRFFGISGSIRSVMLLHSLLDSAPIPPSVCAKVLSDRRPDAHRLRRGRPSWSTCASTRT